MTTLIGHRCKSGNIFSRVLLIGRGLFLIEICKQISKGYRWKRKLVSYVISSVLANRIRWWQIVRIPPVPIPNTVVKTYRGENTWRATAWKDSSLPASKLNKSEITWISSFAFSFVNIYPLMDFDYLFFRSSHMLVGSPHPPSAPSPSREGKYYSRGPQEFQEAVERTAFNDFGRINVM